MGDSYREALQKYHKKSGFRKVPDGAPFGGPARTLPEERWTLRIDYFAKTQGKARKLRQKAARRRIIHA